MSTDPTAQEILDKLDKLYDSARPVERVSHANMVLCDLLNWKPNRNPLMLHQQRMVAALRSVARIRRPHLEVKLVTLQRALLKRPFVQLLPRSVVPVLTELIPAEPHRPDELPDDILWAGASPAGPPQWRFWSTENASSGLNASGEDLAKFVQVDTSLEVGDVSVTFAVNLICYIGVYSVNWGSMKLISKTVLCIWTR